MTTYFINCKNLDELKKAYKAAAMKNHPDMGGDTATMQAINAEYSARFEVLKRSQNEQAAEDTTGRTHATTESAGDFIAIIAALLKLDGLEIELCGRWLWIGGNTREHKEALKAAGGAARKSSGPGILPRKASAGTRAQRPWQRSAASTAAPPLPVPPIPTRSRLDRGAPPPERRMTHDRY